MAMEQVNFPVCAPLEFLPVGWAQKAVSIKSLLHEYPLLCRTRTATSQLSVFCHWRFRYSCGFRAETCLQLCLFLLSFWSHLTLYHWKASESVAVLNPLWEMRLPPTPTTCRVNECLRVCHQRGLCYLAEGKRSFLCVRMHRTLLLTNDFSPFRFLSVPPCHRFACTPPTPTFVQTLNFRLPLAISLTLWKVQQTIQNFKKNSV